jgi:hypothetical protein
MHRFFQLVGGGRAHHIVKLFQCDAIVDSCEKFIWEVEGFWIQTHNRQVCLVELVLWNLGWNWNNLHICIVSCSFFGCFKKNRNLLFVFEDGNDDLWLNSSWTSWMKLFELFVMVELMNDTWGPFDLPLKIGGKIEMLVFRVFSVVETGGIDCPSPVGYVFLWLWSCFVV